MNSLHLLLAARKRISTPGCWTSGAVARNLQGQPVQRDCAKAVSWSLQGAVLVEAHYGGLVEALRFLSAVSGNRSLQTINDKEGLKACLSLLDSAIALAERKYPIPEESYVPIPQV